MKWITFVFDKFSEFGVYTLVLSLVFGAGFIAGSHFEPSYFRLVKNGDPTNLAIGLIAFVLSLITLAINKSISDARARKEKLTDKLEQCLALCTAIKTLSKKVFINTKDDIDERYEQLYQLSTDLKACCVLYFNSELDASNLVKDLFVYFNSNQHYIYVLKERDKAKKNGDNRESQEDRIYMEKLHKETFEEHSKLLTTIKCFEDDILNLAISRTILG